MKLTHVMNAAAIVLAIWASPLPAQEAPVHRAEDLVLRSYAPENHEAPVAANAIEEFYGRRIVTEENGGKSVENIYFIGDSVLIYDTPEHAQRILDALKQIDAEASSEPAPQASGYEMFEYRPRHVMLDDLLEVLQPFRRVADFEGTNQLTSNISTLSARGVLLVRDTPERIARIRSLLESVDRPRPQVMVTCWIIRATRDAGRASESLPGTLVKDLSRLVPYEHFELRSTGVLRAAAGAGMPIELALQSADGAEYELRMIPMAYDDETGTLTLRDCRFQAGREAMNFQTSTDLAAGEFVVIGASGAEPTFVVLRQQPVGAAM